MPIITRAEWGAVHDNGFGPRKLPATQAWLHHSAGLAPDLLPPFDDDYQAIRDLEAIGEARFGKGISYTRLITPVGLIFEGHSIDRVGSHTANRNTVAVGYCLVGNYSQLQPTAPQLVALAWCLQHDHANGWLDRPALDGGHRDLKATECPGNHAYAAIPTINRLAAGPTLEDIDMRDLDEIKQLIIGYGQRTERIDQGHHGGWGYGRRIEDTQRMVAELLAISTGGAFDSEAVLDRLEAGARSAVTETILPAVQRIELALATDRAEDAKALLAELSRQLNPAQS